MRCINFLRIQPGEIAPGTSSADRDAANDAPIAVLADATLSIQQQRLRLPIFASRDQLLFLVEKYPVVVLVGQTGSGKTTQLPQYLFEEGWGKVGVIACSQPRRIAAISVAARVAEEMGVRLGNEVGYTVRFDDCTSSKTSLRYMTDGMLFREALLDPLLSRYGVIMLDEAHERSLYTDVMLGLLKKIMKKRQDLRVIISSATLDAEAFYRFFNTNSTSNKSEDSCVIVSIEGRMHPVQVKYLDDPCPDYVNKAVDTVLDIHTSESFGDVLVFLSGKDEVDTAIDLINENAEQMKISSELYAVPLYSGLTMDEQLRVFAVPPEGVRKVVVATNIAEASVTIDGIVFVVDAGYVKIRAYNPKSSLDSLIKVPISKASAQQRAGRAGRTRPGTTYRLYTEASFESFADTSIPEMQRTNLIAVILQLKAMGIENVLRFDFMSPPSAESMAKALEILYSLKCLDDYGRLTVPFGLQLAEFPLEPPLAAMLLNSAVYKCSEEILTIAAMLTVQNVFFQGSGQRKAADEEKRKFSVEEGDHVTYLNVYNAFCKNQHSGWCYKHFLNYKNLTRAVAIRGQLSKYLKRFGVPMQSCRGDTVAVRKCIVSGFFAQAAKIHHDGSYRTIRENQTVYIHPSSVLFNRSPKYVLFNEVIQTEKVWIRDVTVIEDPAWLTEAASHFYEFRKIQKK